MDFRWLALGASSLLLASAWLAGRDGGTDTVEFDEKQLAIIAKMTGLGTPPPDPTNAFADDPRAAKLGQRLFFERRVSGDGKLNCAHCHDPQRGFTDGKTLAEGVGKTAR